MKRRSFLKGLIAAPVVITTPGLLMPVKPRIQYPITVQIDALYVTPQDMAFRIAKDRVSQQIARAMGIQRFELTGQVNAYFAQPIEFTPSRSGKENPWQT